MRQRRETGDKHRRTRQTYRQTDRLDTETNVPGYWRTVGQRHMASETSYNLATLAPRACSVWSAKRNLMF